MNYSLIKIFAQATLDAMGPPENQEDLPTAMKQNKTQDESEIETGDPMETQMNGILVNKLPRTKVKNDKILKLIELFYAQGQ